MAARWIKCLDAELNGKKPELLFLILCNCTSDERPAARRPMLVGFSLQSLKKSSGNLTDRERISNLCMSPCVIPRILFLIQIIGT